ncbi:hypothetical protein D1007_60613 [Hordeum vulgare]|nr:hypothetical protein D1007_60613 [Hordeum vulgare]
MEPPRRTKRPAVDPDDDDVKAAAEARRCYGPAAYDFLDDDEMPDGAASQGTGGDTGFLDATGSFVERAARGGNKDEAWLGAAGDVDGDGQAAMTKRARKAMDRQEEDERILEGVVGSRAVFDIKKRIAALLRPGETAPRALRRLKGAPGAPAGDRRVRGKEMDELVDASAELVRRGDLDVYTDDREALEDASARKDIRVLTLAIRPPSGSPTAPPVDVIAGHDDMINPAIKAVASGKVSAIDLEMDLQSLRVPSGEHVPSPALQDNPIGSSTCTSSSTSGDTNGERDLYDLGVATALATGSGKLLSDVARYFGQEAKTVKRPRRRARQGNAPAPPVKFSLRLSEEEAMEDVAAVTLAKDVVKLEGEVMPARRNAKRRRH